MKQRVLDLVRLGLEFVQIQDVGMPAPKPVQEALAQRGAKAVELLDSNAHTAAKTHYHGIAEDKRGMIPKPF